MSASHRSIISSSTQRLHCKFFDLSIGLNSYTSCSSRRVKLIFVYCNVISYILNRVISKNSIIRSSNRSALPRVIERYFSRSSFEICDSSRSKVRYPITEESGVFKSCARYIIRSFFRCSFSFASLALLSASCFN